MAGPQDDTHPDDQRIDRYRQNFEGMFRHARGDCRETRAHYLDLGMAWYVLVTELELALLEGEIGQHNNKDQESLSA